MALLDRLVHLPPEEVEPEHVSQSVVAYGILHSTGKAASVTARLQQHLLERVAQKTPSFSAEELVLCVVGLGKLQWGFGEALVPLQEALTAAASADSASGRMSLKQLRWILQGFFESGQLLGVAADALQRRQAQLQKDIREVVVKVE